MTAREIKKLAHRVTDYVERITLFGKRTITIWYGNIVDTIYFTEENEQAIKELEEYVDKRRPKH